MNNTNYVNQISYMKYTNKVNRIYLEHYRVKSV